MLLADPGIAVPPLEQRSAESWAFCKMLEFRRYDSGNPLIHP